LLTIVIIVMPSTDTTIPLAQVVDSFDIFFSNQGSQGKLGHASKQQLENTFGSSKDVDAVQALLEKGTLQSGKGMHSSALVFERNKGLIIYILSLAFASGGGSQNDVRGSKVIDTKSRGTTGAGYSR
jgi:hypothetical protein